MLGGRGFASQVPNVAPLNHACCCAREHNFESQNRVRWRNCPGFWLPSKQDFFWGDTERFVIGRACQAARQLARRTYYSCAVRAVPDSVKRTRGSRVGDPPSPAGAARATAANFVPEICSCSVWRGYFYCPSRLSSFAWKVWRCGALGRSLGDPRASRATRPGAAWSSVAALRRVSRNRSKRLRIPPDKAWRVANGSCNSSSAGRRPQSLG